MENRKFLTESARISDAYSQMYARKAQVNESSECGSFNAELRKGDLPIEGKGSAKTGSKLGRRPMLPFEKRDAKSTAGHAVPMRKNRQFEKVCGNCKSTGGKAANAGLTQDGLGKRDMLPFEKRDEKPTAIGRIAGVKDVGCVKGIKESEEDFEMDIIDTDAENGVSEIDADGSDEEACGCCEECKEIFQTVSDVLEQIYDNLSDDDKALVDEVKAQIEEKLSDGEEDAEDADSSEEEETDESTVNEGVGKKVVKSGVKAAEKAAAEKAAAEAAAKAAEKAGAEGAVKAGAEAAEKSLAKGGAEWIQKEIKELASLKGKLKAVPKDDKAAREAIIKEFESKKKELLENGVDRLQLRGIEKDFYGFFGDIAKIAGEKADDVIKNNLKKTAGAAAGAGALAGAAGTAMLTNKSRDGLEGSGDAGVSNATHKKAAETMDAIKNNVDNGSKDEQDSFKNQAAADAAKAEEEKQRIYSLIDQHEKDKLTQTKDSDKKDSREEGGLLTRAVGKGTKLFANSAKDIGDGIGGFASGALGGVVKPVADLANALF